MAEEERTLEIDIRLRDSGSSKIVALANAKIIIEKKPEISIWLNGMTIMRRRRDKRLFVAPAAKLMGEIYYNLFTLSLKLKYEVDEAVFIKAFDEGRITREEYDRRASG
jgi:hypothetical protein